MQDRNVLSLIRRITGAGLSFITLAVAAPTFADNTDNFQLFSLLSTSLAKPAVTHPEHDTLPLQEVRAAPKPPSSIDLTTNPDNLWERVRHGFAMTNLNDDQTLYYQQWYQNRPDALRRMVERSRPYLYHIVEELERRGMPSELALLPMVESAFNPMAYSPAHAAGLWQFIPATGKRFNLEQNWWKDERRDIVAATGAALEYLQIIYEMQGDWHLALASYNWGEGAVKRAVEKNDAHGLGTDYGSLKMPNETRNYVPKLQALKNIFGNPKLMAELGIPEVLNQPYFATVDTRQPIDVKIAAHLAEMPVSEFIALNPSHNRPVIMRDSAVVIPEDKLQIFQNNLKKYTAPLTKWQAYTIKAGEKISKVAARFGITLAELYEANGLHPRVSVMHGSAILVPAGFGAIDLANLENMTAPRIIEPRAAKQTQNKSSKYVPRGTARQVVKSSRR